jgi:polyhydroxyalkanoate synthesis regulator phasin
MTQPKRSAASSKSTATTRQPAAKRAPARRPASTEAAADNNVAQGLASLRDAISRLAPGNVVVLSRERLQEAFDEAVRRGRMTRDDAEHLVSSLVSQGRRQTEGVIGQLEDAASRLRHSPPGDRVVRAADRARRTVGVGPSFPILGYDDLTAAQVVDRLGALSPPQLRKVRDYERRHANRKSVLDAIERGLA